MYFHILSNLASCHNYHSTLICVGSVNPSLSIFVALYLSHYINKIDPSMILSYQSVRVFLLFYFIDSRSTMRNSPLPNPLHGPISLQSFNLQSPSPALQLSPRVLFFLPPPSLLFPSRPRSPLHLFRYPSIPLQRLQRLQHIHASL